MPATTNVQLTVTPEAQQTISDMSNRVEEVGQKYGYSSDEYRTMLRSLTGALITVLRLGGRVMQDGPLGLYGDSFIQYGVIFFPKRHGEKRDALLGEWSVHS